MEKIVVVGANHAGTATINTILDNYHDKEVIVFDANTNISFLGCGMALWIGKQIASPDGLFYATKEMLEKKGAKIHLESKVNHINTEKKCVEVQLENGHKLMQPYDKLILATGSVPIVPNIPGMDLENIQFVKLFQDAKDVIEKLNHKEIKKVAVVGAGYIGVELAEAFVRGGKEVRLLDMADTCLANYYDDEFSARMADHMHSKGVELNFGEQILRVEGDGKVERIVTNKGEYEVDMVVFGVGFLPNTTLGKEKITLFRNGAYVVNRHQMTNVQDIYAIGDCATVYDNALQDTSYIALATNAVRSGIIAAHNVCGNAIESEGVQGSNAISIWGLHMVSTGLSLKKAKQFGFHALVSDFEDYQKPTFIESGNHLVKIRIVYEEHTRRILGAQVMSEHDISMVIHLFSMAIQEKVTIDRLKLFDVFFLPHFNQPYNYITMAALQAK